MIHYGLRLILILLLLGYAGVHARAGQETHGNSESKEQFVSPGDAVADEFEARALRIAEELTQVPMELLPTPFFAVSFHLKIYVIKISSLPEVLYEGQPVDAVNTPYTSPQTITVNRTNWATYKNDENSKDRLVIHEMLSLMGIPDTGKQISDAILAEVLKVRAATTEVSITGLNDAVLTCDRKKLETLLPTGKIPNLIFQNGGHLLHLAARRACPDVVAWLVSAGVPVDSLSLDGWTPLFTAVWFSHSVPQDYIAQERYVRVIDVLLKEGADVNAWQADTSGYSREPHFGLESVLYRAVAGVRIDKLKATQWSNPLLIERLLKEKSLDLNRGTSNGLTPLAAAIWSGNSYGLHELVMRGAELNSRFSPLGSLKQSVYNLDWLFAEGSYWLSNGNGNQVLADVRFLVSRGALVSRFAIDSLTRYLLEGKLPYYYAVEVLRALHFAPGTDVTEALSRLERQFKKSRDATERAYLRQAITILSNKK